MSASTSVQTRVEARVWARSTTWVANELARVLIEIVNLRGLPLDYVHQHLELFVASFRTWVTGRHLDGVYLEVYDEPSGALLERYDLGLNYDVPARSSEEKFETRIGLLERELARREAAHPGCRYRIFVQLTPGAPALPGWNPAELQDTSHLRRKDVGGIINTSRIGVAFALWL